MFESAIGRKGWFPTTDFVGLWTTFAAKSRSYRLSAARVSKQADSGCRLIQINPSNPTRPPTLLYENMILSSRNHSVCLMRWKNEKARPCKAVPRGGRGHL